MNHFFCIYIFSPFRNMACNIVTVCLTRLVSQILRQSSSLVASCGEHGLQWSVSELLGSSTSSISGPMETGSCKRVDHSYKFSICQYNSLFNYGHSRSGLQQYL